MGQCGQEPSRFQLIATIFLLGSLLVAIDHANAATDGHDERFIGWSGETYRPGDQHAEKADGRRRWIETISWRPRAYIYHNFLSQEEADYMVKLVEKTVSRSHVVDVKTGHSKMDPIRTSWGGSIERGQTPVISAIEQRIAEWTHLPPDHGEPIQVLRYSNGQKYDAHWDWFDDPVHGRANSTENRAATVLLYLGQVEEGGETALPIAVPIDPKAQLNKEGRSACAANGTLAVKPTKGDALLFWDMKLDGRTVCRRSLHSSCPTIKGMKWTATKWIHNHPYGPGYDPLKIAARCVDSKPNCKARAEEGQCDTEPERLTGLLGECRRSCGDCVDCADGDLVCMRKNLRSLRAARRKARKP